MNKFDKTREITNGKLKNKISTLDSNNHKIINLGNLKIYALVWKEILSSIPSKGYIKDGEIIILYASRQVWDLSNGFKIGTKTKKIGLNTKFNSVELSKMLSNDGLICNLSKEGIQVNYTDVILRDIMNQNEKKKKTR